MRGSTDEHIRTVRLFGWALILLSAVSTVLFFGVWWPELQEMRAGTRYFLVVTIGFDAFTGLGTVLLTRWGYVLLKIFLYTMLLAFPVGTAIAWWMLSYMRRHNVKPYFGFAGH